MTRSESATSRSESTTSRRARVVTWCRGTLLVARRGLLETLRSKTFRVVTGILLVASAVVVAVPLALSGRPTTYTLATVGPPPAALASTLTAAGREGDVQVRFRPLPDAAAVRAAVAADEATAGLSGSTLFTTNRRPATFTAVVSQTVVALETARLLASAGLAPDEVAAVTSVRPPAQVSVGGSLDTGRSAVGFAVGIVLYLAISMAGASIASTVATEKSTRVAEVLLAVLRPSQALVGTVAAVGVVTLGQLVVLATPLAVASTVTGKLALPPTTAGDLALGIAWFVLGFGLYAFAFAAAAALVDKITDVSAVTSVVTMTLMGAYFGAIFVTTQNPADTASTVLSVVPVTAPLAMPVRWASGEVPVWQLALAMSLTAVTVVLVVALASRLYARALVITGHRVRLRELRSGTPAPPPGPPVPGRPSGRTPRPGGGRRVTSGRPRAGAGRREWG